MKKNLFNELKKLITTVNDSSLMKLNLKNRGLELTINKEEKIPSKSSSASYQVLSFPQSQITSPSANIKEKITSSSKISKLEHVEKSKDNYLEIKSPMAGTFYEAASPGEMPFVKVGTQVSMTQTVCIIEAMKLMNEIEAETNGEVLEILVKNGELVEYGKTLMKIKPS